MRAPRDGKREAEGDRKKEGKMERNQSVYIERPWENWGHSVQTISIPQAWFRRSDHTLLLPEGSSIAACGFLG